MYNNLSSPRIFADKPLMDKTTVASIIFIIIGIIILLFTGKYIKNYIEKSKIYIETTSTVIDYQYKSQD